MSLIKYIERLKHMDDLISRRATGPPDEFAQKLGISKSMLMINLMEMKKLGAPIKYSVVSQSYVYARSCDFRIGFELDKSAGNARKGGYKNNLVNFTIPTILE
jgi:hypothetical protein